MAVKAGYKGAVYIGDVKIAGMATWGYSGTTLAMLPDDEFLDEHITHIAGQFDGGDITITGNYLMSEDAGQRLLKTKFDERAQITDVMLYLSYSEDQYMIPDNTTTPASFATITNYDAVGNDKSGVGTFTCTMKVSGKMKPVY